MRIRQSDIDGEALADAISGDGLDAWAWGTAGIVLAVAIVLSRIAKRVICRVLKRRLDPSLAALIGRLVGYLIIVVGFVYALESLGVDIGLVVGALGIAGFALAFALKDILENFVAGVLLQLQRPFRYGDQVEINDHEGTISEIDTRLVTMITPAGETIKIPSATVIKSDINNYTQQGGRRTTLPVGVAYGTDLRQAKAVLERAVASADGVRAEPGPEVLLEGFGDSSIDFVVRFWHEPTIAVFWSARSNVAFAVNDALAAADIKIPFPQRTLWWAGDT
ncbi:MAG: mechanosensitive ion channel family protein [Ilumatobacter sp.]|nr:mechanosensitive ion channel family protein [Ilumatobacter sp.]